MYLCESDNIIKLYKFYDEKDEFIFIIELYDNDLLKELIKRPSGFTIDETRCILRNLNRAFKVMRANNIVHRDIKAENILIKYLNEKKTSFKSVLADFGVSKQVSKITQKEMTKGIGTMKYAAPEILNNQPYDEKCELWSLGIFIYFLLFKKYPYEGENPFELYNIIKIEGYKVLENIKDEKLKSLLKKLLCFKSTDRITWKEYFEDPFFAL